MKAGLITGQAEVAMVEVEDPAVVPGSVIVDITLCGICGTEVGSYRTGVLHSPSVCGHEWVGVVSARGSGVEALQEGDRVVIGVGDPCGRCADCRAGHAAHCKVVNLMARGKDPLAPAHGGFAARIRVAAERVVPADPRLTDVQAAMVEPAAVAFHGIRRSGIEPGDLVVVVGAGPIGLLAQQFARAAGAGRVMVIEPVASRRALARELGADDAVEPDAASEEILSASDGVGADVVIEASGVPMLLQSAIDLARAGGSVTLLSYLSRSSEISGAAFMAREKTMVGSNAYTRADFSRCMGMIADGRVRVDPLHSRTVLLDQLPAALADLAAGGVVDVKVLVDPREIR